MEQHDSPPTHHSCTSWSELNSHLPLLCAFAVFGLGSWMAINGVYQELPLIAQTAPEGYDIFSYATLAIAIANVLPAAYLSLVCSLSPRARARADKISIVAVVGVGGVVACLLLSAYWDHQTVLFGKPRSAALIFLMFAAGGIDCMTSVLYYPVLVGFPHFAVPALQFGETLTGLLAAVLAAVQTASSGFSVSIFFQVMALVMGFSMVGYWWLERHRPAGELLEGTDFESARRSTMSRDCDGHPATRMCASEDNPIEENRLIRKPESAAVTQEAEVVAEPQSLKLQLMTGQALLSFLENGLHSVVLPHSLALYPNSSTLISVAVKLGFGMAAFATIAAHFKRPALRGQPWAWVFLSGTSYLLGIWMLVTASANVYAGSASCGWLTVTATIACKVLVTYTKTSLFIHALSEPSPELALRFSGVGVQIGSLVGAVLFFLLSVTFSYFH